MKFALIAVAALSGAPATQPPVMNHAVLKMGDEAVCRNPKGCVIFAAEALEEAVADTQEEAFMAGADACAQQRRGL